MPTIISIDVFPDLFKIDLFMVLPPIWLGDFMPESARPLLFSFDEVSVCSNPCTTCRAGPHRQFTGSDLSLSLHKPQLGSVYAFLYLALKDHPRKGNACPWRESSSPIELDAASAL